MQELIDKGVLRPSGEIVKDKINLISGAHTPPFVEMLWTVTNGDTDTTNRLYNILTGLYQDGRESEMLEVLRTLYGVLGLPFPEDVEQLAGHPEARGYHESPVPVHFHHHLWPYAGNLRRDLVRPYPYGDACQPGLGADGAKLPEKPAGAGLPRLSNHGVRGNLCRAGADHQHRAGHTRRDLGLRRIYPAAVLCPL